MDHVVLINKKKINILIFFFDSVIRLKIKILLIENICDNNEIIDYLLKKQKYLFNSETAYFFYNFGYKPFKSNEFLIIN